MYVNTELDQFWIIDYRIYDRTGAGKTELDDVHDMLLNVVYHKQLAFHRVLMDTWYATEDLMLYIEQLHKIYYCPLKDNRLVDDSGNLTPYRHVDTLDWTRAEQQHGKLIKIKGFPKEHKVKLFRVVLSPQRTDYVVTNDVTQDRHAGRPRCGRLALEDRAVSSRNQAGHWAGMLSVPQGPYCP